jgi:hypothetical protein
MSSSSAFVSFGRVTWCGDRMACLVFGRNQPLNMASTPPTE